MMLMLIHSWYRFKLRIIYSLLWRKGRLDGPLGQLIFNNS
jgi:hypothetical protein